jgi:hypothetical protein
MGSRYFESDNGAVEVLIEHPGDGIMSIANDHVLADPEAPEVSAPIDGWTEVSLTQYQAKVAAMKAASDQAKTDALEAKAAAAEVAYDDLVAAGVSSAAASTLTGHTPDP